MEVKPKEENNNIFASLGMPAGMKIESVDFSEKVQDQMEILGEKMTSEKANETNMLDLDGDGSVTTSEAVTFFTSLLDNSNLGSNSQLFDFAKKQASNFYNKYSRSVVTDVKEFVEDIQGLVG